MPLDTHTPLQRGEAIAGQEEDKHSIEDRAAVSTQNSIQELDMFRGDMEDEREGVRVERGFPPLNGLAVFASPFVLAFLMIYISDLILSYLIE